MSLARTPSRVKTPRVLSPMFSILKYATGDSTMAEGLGPSQNPDKELVDKEKAAFKKMQVGVVSCACSPRVFAGAREHWCPEREGVEGCSPLRYSFARALRLWAVFFAMDALPQQPREWFRASKGRRRPCRRNELLSRVRAALLYC